MATKNLKKHYSEVEKHLFMEILKEYGNIIEQKRSDCSSLSQKEEAWEEICGKYNASHLISTKRTVAQLRKWWSNIKSAQRGLLTKERQATMATGGGPPPPPVEIDPDVAQVAPHLDALAPILFSSNVNEETTHERQDIMFSHNDMDIEGMTQEAEETSAPAQMCQPAGTSQLMQTIGPVETRKKKATGYSELEQLKLDRIKAMMEDEKKLALLNYNHQELKNEKELEFLTKRFEFDLRKSAAEAELAEKQLTHF